MENEMGMENASKFSASQETTEAMAKEMLVHKFVEKLESKKDSQAIMAEIIQSTPEQVQVTNTDGVEETYEADLEKLGDILQQSSDSPETQRAITLLENALNERLEVWSATIDEDPSATRPTKIEHTFPELQLLMERAGHGQTTQEKITAFVEKYAEK
ncbi:MAG: hypothetical protein Q8O51_01470 [bacterium]|nr:hypothetical protein [bacterium]